MNMDRSQLEQDGHDQEPHEPQYATNVEIHRNVGNESTESSSTPGLITIECSVCLQPCIHPVQLECRHIFCFLCVKGAAHRSKRCALCRSEISAEFFANPKLLRFEDLEQTMKFDNQYQWFYQGGNGWWQYDDRTSQEIEARHKNGEKVFELLIAGFLYIIDLENMIQVRRNDRSRKRKIRRDLISLPGVKGVAGLKYPKSPNTSTDRPVGDGNEQVSQTTQQTQTVPRPSHPDPGAVPSYTNSVVSDTTLRVESSNSNASPTPIVPNNTPQAPNTPVDSPTSSVSSSQQDLSLDMQHLNLGDNLHSDSLPHSPSEDGEGDTNTTDLDVTLMGRPLVEQNITSEEYDSQTYPMTRSRARYLAREEMVRSRAEQSTQNSHRHDDTNGGMEDEEESLNERLV
ncbi:hypothetical protein FSP39_017682 [Pinctada imbricata]|uniref:E3 ubiquitin-protein ligase n=1 Tax=Pinctada imbricata TaxID=66713 RepID=A0AA88XZS9_PINIB|nr:hypothetical protein FSP39_017682 [Pinctada imbricata]